MELTPIFVMGSDHSGTTILYNMLAMHPDVTWFSLFSQRKDYNKGPFRIDLLLDAYDLLLRKMIKFDWRKEAGWRRTRFFFPRPVEGEHLWKGVFPAERAIVHEESEHLMRQVFQRECRKSKKQFLLLKLPRLFEHIPALKAAYPNTKFIHIIRDGRAVAVSLKPKFIQGTKTEREGLLSASEHWLNAVDKIHQQWDQETMIELTYERFCKDVFGCLAIILDFVDLNKGSFPFYRCPAELSSTNQKRLEEIGKTEIDSIQTVQMKYLKKYGYIE